MSEDMNEAEDMDLEEDLESDVGPEEDGDIDGAEVGDEFDDSESTDAEGGSDDAKDDDDEEDEASRPRARRVDDDDDDEEEEEDVEADLNEILRGRMATEDDEEEDEAPTPEADKPGAVNTRKSDEFVCGICFMVVAQKQTELPCPMGDGLEPHQPLDM